MELLPNIKWMQIIYALILLIFGYLFAQWMGNISQRSLFKRFSRHQSMLLRRIVIYALFTLFLVSALHQIGFKLSVILGAAGIFTVAIGFASQTAASNLISGIFLLFEHPFKVGDLIEVNHISGHIESIDLFSTKIKQADNVLVRIPNETMIKASISNFSYFHTRRLGILFNMSYEHDCEPVKHQILTLLKNHKLILDTPEPDIIVQSFSDTSVEFKLMFWTKTVHCSLVKNQINDQIVQIKSSMVQY